MPSKNILTRLKVWTASFKKTKTVEAKTLEQLQQELLESQTALADANKKITELTEVNEALVKKFDETGGSNATTADAVKAAAKKETPGIPTESFEVDGVNYKFIAPTFMFEKQRIVAANAISDTALLGKLVAKKVGFIQRVEE